MKTEPDLQTHNSQTMKSQCHPLRYCLSRCAIATWRLELRFMKTHSSAALLQWMAAGLLLLGTGCQTVEHYSLTYRVWDNEDWRKFSEPAPNPNLALFEAPQRADVLVQYDALSEKRSTVKRRTYYLQQSQAHIAAGKKQKLVRPSVAGGMKPIAVLSTRGALTNPPPGLPVYAVPTQEGLGFTLHRPTESEATVDLPVYAETAGTPTRIVLTPFAVAGDTVMVGVVAAVVGFFWWIQSGAPIH